MVVTVSACISQTHVGIRTMSEQDGLGLLFKSDLSIFISHEAPLAGCHQGDTV